MHLNPAKTFSFVVIISVASAFAAAADLDSAKQAYHQADYATAIKEFTVLAGQGNVEAQLALGKIFMLGQGVPRDSDQAIRWFKPAAEQGNSEAEFFLGSLYLLPRKNVGEGLKWLRRAAEQGDQDAQLLLGKACMMGTKELPRDAVQADMWLRLAAKGNKDFYQDELRAAERQMTADQIARGQALADAWKPSTIAQLPIKETPDRADKPSHF